MKYANAKGFDEESAKKTPSGLPIHSGSHPRWSNRVRVLLNAELAELVRLHVSIDKIPWYNTDWIRCFADQEDR